MKFKFILLMFFGFFSAMNFGAEMSFDDSAKMAFDYYGQGKVAESMGIYESILNRIANNRKTNFYIDICHNLVHLYYKFIFDLNGEISEKMVSNCMDIATANSKASHSTKELALAIILYCLYQDTTIENAEIYKELCWKQLNDLMKLNNSELKSKKVKKIINKIMSLRSYIDSLDDSQNSKEAIDNYKRLIANDEYSLEQKLKAYYQLITLGEQVDYKNVIDICVSVLHDKESNALIRSFANAMLACIIHNGLSGVTFDSDNQKKSLVIQYIQKVKAEEDACKEALDIVNTILNKMEK